MDFKNYYSDMSETYIKSLLNKIKFIKRDKNNIFLKIGTQKFSIIIPSDSEGFFFIDMQKNQSGYDWLNRINEYILEKNPNDLKIILSHIENKYLEEQNNKKKILDLLEEPDISIDIFDINEQKYRKSIEQNLNNLKSTFSLNLNSQNKTAILFSGKTPGLLILEEFFKLRKKYNKNKKIEISLVDDNIFHWKIKFRNFENEKLNEQITFLNSKFGYNYIELEIHFHDKLYPGYPPFIRPTHPRLDNSLMQRITNMKMIQLEFWSPCRDLSFIIDKLRNALELNGTIDYNSEMNDILKYPNGSYHNLEAILIKLASLCDVKDNYEPLDTESYHKIINIGNVTKNNLINDNKKNTPANKASNSVWKAGTGYGNSHTTNWDVNEYIQLQEEKDKQIQSVLNTLIDNIQNYNSQEMPIIYKIIQSSYIIPFIKTYLEGTNMLDIEKHSDLYKLLFTFMQILTTEESIFLFDDHNCEKSLFDVLKKLYDEAIQVFKLGGKDELENGDYDISNMIRTLFEMIDPIFKKYLENVKKHGENEKKKWDLKIETAKTNVNQYHLKYNEIMNDMKFDTIKFSNNFFYKISNNYNKFMIRRLAKEYSSIMNSLPIFFESSIFVRVNEQDNRCMKVLITGPNDTPYDSGIFIFDVYTGDDYPNHAPKMQFLNHGKKRFNPNLYNCGKVCLSLLGTWSGHGGEQWNAKNSTLQQLFISVQSQIFIDEPFYNEPGHETHYNSINGKQKSNDYNNHIKYYTLCHAVYELLQDPNLYPEFTDIIKNHFKLKKDYIKLLCNKWSAQSFGEVEINTKHISNKIIDLLEKL